MNIKATVFRPLRSPAAIWGILWLGFAAPAQPPDLQPDGMSGLPPYVSMIELVSNKAQFHGQRLSVRGYLVAKFANQAIYLSMKHAVNRLTKNALWVRIDRKALKEELLEKLSGRYVTIEGVFNMSDMGHLSGMAGAMTNVTRVAALE